MKKVSMLFAIAALLVISSCSKDETAPTILPDPIEAKIIDAIFNIGNNANGAALAPRKTNLKSTSESLPINETITGEYGGSVVLSGTETYSDTKSSITLNQAYNQYGIFVDNQIYKTSGNITYLGNANFNSNSISATIAVNGSLNVIGTNYNKTTVVALTMTMTSNNTSFTLKTSGTIGGKAVNYTTTMNM